MAVMSRRGQKKLAREWKFPQSVMENPHGYVFDSKSCSVISVDQYSNGRNFADSIRYIDSQHAGMSMAPMPAFGGHLVSVSDARFKNSALVDAFGSRFSDNEINGMFDNRFGNLWVYLDAHFVDRDGKMYVNSDHHVSRDGFGNEFIVTGRTERLKSSFKFDSLVELSFNSQGMSNGNTVSEYNKGRVIYSGSKPSDGSVARFGASSVGAGLLYDRDPRGSDSALGVLLHALGVRAKS